MSETLREVVQDACQVASIARPEEIPVMADGAQFSGWRSASSPWTSLPGAIVKVPARCLDFERSISMSVRPLAILPLCGQELGVRRAFRSDHGLPGSWLSVDEDRTFIELSGSMALSVFPVVTGS